VKNFLRQYRNILMYGDNQVLEMLVALSAMIITPALMHGKIISSPPWFLFLGVIFGVLVFISIGLNELLARLFVMRLIWSWFFAIIVLEYFAGTYNFYTLYHVWIELVISTYNIWRINREIAHRACRAGRNDGQY
tara:strand:- start:133 stop:537 length:405 start_codon:yes stop_codon:yes gene_type:complete